MEQLVGGFDCLFLPNLNPFSVSRTAKLAVTIHDLSPVIAPEFYDAKRRLWHSFLNYQKTFTRADIIFAVSEYTKLDIIRAVSSAGKKIKAHLSLALIRFSSVSNWEHAALHAEARNVVHSAPVEYILFLNTVEPRKNLSNVLKAFELMEGDTELVIAGRQGWKYSDIFEQLEGTKKRGKIRYLGYIDEAHKPAIIALARALVYPSFYEGFGFQPLEAMACGVPTVVSQVTALPEIAGDASLLVNPYNINDLAHALTEVTVNESLRQQLIAKGAERVRKFRWQTAAAQVLAALNNLRQ